MAFLGGNGLWRRATNEIKLAPREALDRSSSYFQNFIVADDVLLTEIDRCS